jgi:pimeloyl-ACP methyl ester carboxylesterase
VSKARDLDALRAALGEEKLTFFSISYGTLIGEQYAELFPRHIRAMALDSNEDHSVGALTWVTRLSQAQEQSYGQFADWCRRTAACALYPRDAGGVLDQLYARAQRGTITVPGFPDNRITPELLIDFIRGKLTGTGQWPDLADNLLAILNEPVTATTADPSAPTPRGNEAASTSQEATRTAIFCEDHQWSTSSLADLRALRRAMARVALHTHLSFSALKDVTGCLGWPQPVVNPQRRLVVRDAPPILMVNSRYDVATPYPGAVSAAEQIGPSATLLTYDGTSHVDYEETGCVRAAVGDYLTTLATPPPYARCPAVFPH